MFTTHGHHIPGTLHGPKPQNIINCGGPGFCAKCSLEAFKSSQKTESGPDMEFSTFVRKPFMVEAVEVTVENIHELSPLIGEVREKDNGTPYIQVDRRLVPNIFRVYPGFWVTKMGDNVRCYSKRIFFEQFTQSNPQIEDWVHVINGGKVSSDAHG